MVDLIIASTGSNGTQLMKNTGTGNGNWMEMNLVGTKTNKFAVGSTVEITVDGVTLKDDITVGSGYAGQNSYTMHFGIGDATTIEAVKIKWPDGSVDQYDNVSANKRYLAVESESFDVFDVTRYQEALGRTSTISLLSLPDPEPFEYVSKGYSVARLWNEALLNAIRRDLARPTVHARNLFHTGVAMYDAWAAYDEVASTFFLGKKLGDYYCPFNGVPAPADKKSAREEAISYAAYRLLKHRFEFSPGASRSLGEFSKLFQLLGYDDTFTSTDYSTGSPAALGNYIASKLIDFGLQDGSNEQHNYMNQYYVPVNPSFFPLNPGDSSIVDPNRWQPLAFDVFIDQSGNVIPGSTPAALSPEWGEVVPFSLTDKDLTKYKKGNYDYWVYHDPGPPPFIDTVSAGGLSSEYMWTFALVAVWSSHLDHTDGEMIDISPASQGNITQFPTTILEERNFYNLLKGGDHGTGYTINPATGEPYQPQIVPRGDYARVLAEFWADGPNSETPPGHWFTILNYVSDHPKFKKRFGGQGSELDPLEWDVKAYFMLGGAMHDAAVTAWGIKGYYDYVRPVSAIRSMAKRGQSSDPGLPHYHPAGIPLHEGYIELIQEGDPLAGSNGENVGKIKIRAWRGPKFIPNPANTVAGVDWILADNWLPYQRPTFVTPPFPGYISGHSTFSRTAAELMTLLTGDEYFPGGMSEFHAPQNEYLVFEDGPSVDLTLQWAKYKDASDQCSLSRIWGGIHPPADDIPGRIIGQELGPEAFEFASKYFSGLVTETEGEHFIQLSIYPNPVAQHVLYVKTEHITTNIKFELLDLAGRLVYKTERNTNNSPIELDLSSIAPGIYLLRLATSQYTPFVKKIIIR